MPATELMAAATVGSAAIGAHASSSAAKTQADAANQATQAQLQMFNLGRGDLAPYRNAGAGALPGLNALLGIDSGGAFTGGGGGGTKTGFAGVSPIEPGMTMGGAAGGASGGGLQLGSLGGLGTLGLMAAGGHLLGGQGGGQAPGAAFPNADWNAYLQANPDVMTWAQGGGGSDVLGPNATLAERAALHYQTFGQKEHRQLGMLPAQAGGAQAGGAGAGANGMQAMLEKIPGYQFARDQGIRAANNALGARGTTGAQAKGIARFVTGLADSTYGDQISRLQNYATMGANAAAQTGTNAVGSGNGIANSLMGAGQARASGQVGMANALSGGLQNVAGLYSDYRQRQTSLNNDVMSAAASNPNLF